MDIEQIDVSRFEKVLFATFAHLEGESFRETYENTNLTKGSTKNFVETENGVKVINGSKLYQCYYECECGHSGKRFIKEDATNTSCHKCHQELSISPATDNDAHDESYNYFIAKKSN